MKKQLLFLSVIIGQMLLNAAEGEIVGDRRLGGYKPNKDYLYNTESGVRVYKNNPTVVKTTGAQPVKPLSKGSPRLISKWNGHGPVVLSPEQVVLRDMPPYAPKPNIISNLYNIWKLSLFQDVVNNLSKNINYIKADSQLKQELTNTLTEIQNAAKDKDTISLNYLANKFQSQVNFWVNVVNKWNKKTDLSAEDKALLEAYVSGLIHAQDLIYLSILQKASKESQLDRFNQALKLYHAKFIKPVINSSIKNGLIERSIIENAINDFSKTSDSQEKLRKANDIIQVLLNR